MESDFTTRQHLESLTPHSDPNLAEVLNNYKFPPPSTSPMPTHPPAPMGGYPMGVYPVMPSQNDMLLGNILGRMEANLQNQTPKGGLGGLQLSFSSELLKWLVLIIILAVLIWVVWQLRKPSKDLMSQRMKKLEKEFRKMRRYRKRRKNPKKVVIEEDGIEDIDEGDDFEDF